MLLVGTTPRATDEHGPEVGGYMFPPGVILEVARQAGIQVPGNAAGRDKFGIRCPCHDDKKASAFVSAERNLLYCSVCGPFSAKKLAERLGVSWRGVLDSIRPRVAAAVSATPPIARSRTPAPTTSGVATPTRAVPASAASSSFSVESAENVWRIALANAHGELLYQDDLPAFAYLNERGLGPSFEVGAYGIIARRQPLPLDYYFWAATGYRIVCPTYDALGAFANIQARCIEQREPKTLFPTGSRASGTAFATADGLAVLRRTWTGERRIVVAEGLTDFLALSFTCPFPAISAPGARMAKHVFAGWIADFEVVLALDVDGAGDAAIQGASDNAYANGARLVRRLEWPRPCKDVCDVLELYGAEHLERIFEKTVVQG